MVLGQNESIQHGNINLLASRLNKLKSAGMALTLSSNMMIDEGKTNFPHDLLLTDRQVMGFQVFTWPLQISHQST